MKTSAISLAFESKNKNELFLINILDTPGHIDFTQEVSSALKLVDGALILVDVIEGICCQTINVIRQAWRENIKCILVFNKIDKLISELHYSPEEIYQHLFIILEKVNAIMSSFLMSEIAQIECDSDNKENVNIVFL